MTIINPKKTNKITSMLIVILFVLVVVSVVFGVLSYNHTVSLRHDIVGANNSIEEMRVENVELRRRLLKITDTTLAKQVVQGIPLVRDRNPLYLPVARLDEEGSQVGIAAAHIDAQALGSY